MLKKPAFEFPMEDGKSCVRAENGKYYAMLDRNAAIVSLNGLRWFAAEAPVGEEISIWSNYCAKMSGNGEIIGYCEFNLAPSHKNQRNQKARHKPHGTLDQKAGRLDYFISSEEASSAYEALTALLEITEDKRRVAEITVFETLVIRLEAA